MKLRCLSLHQPWAWAMVNPNGPRKSIENRGWIIKPGPMLVHASLAVVQADYEDLIRYARAAGYTGEIPHPKYLRRGGIVGAFNVISVLTPEHWSQDGNPWHMRDKYGHPVSNVVELPFRPYKGKQGWFHVELTAEEIGILAPAGLLNPEPSLFQERQAAQ